jgi:NitT/TauT family transport system ATP-binding protein
MNAGGQAATPLLELVGLGHRFGRSEDDPPVLDNLSLHVDHGEIVCLIGRSGSGKSTVLGIVAGFLTPERGRCLLAGAPVTGSGPDRCVVFQEDALFPWLTVRENIGFGLRGTAWPRAVISHEVDRFLALVGLEAYADYLPRALSGGMKQRVALARVLVRAPRILLMDEPFGALDPHTREEMQELLVRLAGQHGQTVLFVTHDVAEAVSLADRVLMLDGQSGRIGRELAMDLARPRNRTDREFHRSCALLQGWLRP